jgi:monoamine oxidase
VRHKAHLFIRLPHRSIRSFCAACRHDVLSQKNERDEMSMKAVNAANTAVVAPATMKLLDVVVIGGGLSGVLVSHGLQQQQRDWRLLEARPVLGGRLANDVGGHQIDLGGAWVWPAHQPRMRKLLCDLEIPTFLQPDDSSSTRIDGGAVRIVERLAEDLPAEHIQFSTAVTSCKLQRLGDDKTPVVEIQTAANETLWARRVVWAVPPRLVHEHVRFEPPLSPAKQTALASAHTWMAGVTKIALVYPNSRFWSLEESNMGMPSHLGPAFQVYDSSTKGAPESALTFFALVDQDKDDATLAKTVANQMQQVWKYMGQLQAAHEVHSYSQYFVQRWPQQTYISEDPKPRTIHPHPHPVGALSTPEWDGLLEFAGSETDRLSPGVMEGAVGAAQRVLQSLEDAWKTLKPIPAESCAETASSK